jgi:hypothetical protein
MMNGGHFAGAEIAQRVLMDVSLKILWGVNSLNKKARGSFLKKEPKNFCY